MLLGYWANIDAPRKANYTKGTLIAEFWMADYLVLRTFYVDADIDEENRLWVGGYGYSSALYCHWLVAGMKAVDKGAALPPPKPHDQARVVRTIHIKARIDSRLHRETFLGGVPRADLVMGYLRLGKECARPLKRATAPKSLI